LPRTKEQRASERLEITRLGTRGDGIAETAKGPVFVPFAVPGDVVEAAVEPGPRSTVHGRLLRILQPGPDRVDPACRHFGECGGCALQHLASGAYERWIVERLRTALGHHGFTDPPVSAPAVSPPGSRRRLALTARRAKEGPVLGFARRQSHQLVDVGECPVARAPLAGLLEPLRASLPILLQAGGAVRILLTETAGGIDLLIEAARPAGLAEREALGDLAQSYDLAALHWSDTGDVEPIAVRRAAEMDFDGIRVSLPPGAFVQATAEGEAALRAAVEAWTEDAGTIADLFAGLGTFALPLARRARVEAVEGARDLCAAMEGAARRAHLDRLAPAHRDLFRRPLTAEELAPFDAVIFDPPRAGAKAQAAELARSGVARAIAVSCNPNTFSRDARILAEGGFRLIELRPVDQFLWSGALELVALFERG